MKNLILKALHIFRIWEDIQYSENITIDVSDSEIFWCHRHPDENDPIIDDIITFIYEKLASDKLLNRKCQLSKWVYIKIKIIPSRIIELNHKWGGESPYKSKSIIGFKYLDSNLYHPVRDYKIIKRQEKIHSLSNSKNESKIKSFFRSLFITNPIIEVNKFSEVNYLIDELIDKLKN